MQDFNLDVKHIVAESTALGATYYANHIFSVKMAEDTDNGVICSRGNYVGDEYYEFADYAAGKEPMLVLAPPVMPFDGLKIYTSEERFYNAKDAVARCYVLGVGDRFSLSEVAFDTVPSEGQYVTFDAASKTYIVSDSADNSQFCAKVLTKIVRSNLVMYKLVVESV
jgi:hypothetical protein